jgi:zona occludens toxin
MMNPKTGMLADGIQDGIKGKGAAAEVPNGLQTPQNPQYQGEGKILNYIEAHQPQIPDMPFTAPIYNELVQPKVAPYPAACVLMRNECKCYTQQGTKLKTSESVCKQIVENGFFVEWQQDQPQQQTAPQQIQSQVYPARDGGKDFTHAQGMSLRASPNNAPAT